MSLGGQGGVYTRNLYQDFMGVQGFNPSGAQIARIIFELDSLGWATIDNICIGKAQ